MATPHVHAEAHTSSQKVGRLESLGTSPLRQAHPWLLRDMGLIAPDEFNTAHWISMHGRDIQEQL